MLNKLILLLPLIGCSYDIIKPKPAPHATQKELLQAQYELNLAKLSGWPSETDCDGLLFASEALMGGVKLDLYKARDTEGKWYRSPSHDCFSDSRSRSEFSNDMLVGLILAVNPSTLDKYHTWLVEHDYLMGEGDRGATFVKPNVLGVLRRRIGMKAIRIPYLRNDKDYVRHIQMLMIHIDSKTTGYMTKNELELLESYDKGDDYLLAAIVSRYNGNYDDAIRLLLEEGEPPTYVRGDSPERYRLAHWLFAAKIILE